MPKVRFGVTAVSVAVTNGSWDKDQDPKVCPHCKSPYWDRPRQSGHRPLTSVREKSALDCPPNVPTYGTNPKCVGCWMARWGGLEPPTLGLRGPALSTELPARWLVGFGLRRPVGVQPPSGRPHQLLPSGGSGDAFRHSPTALHFRLNKGRHFCRAGKRPSVKYLAHMTWRRSPSCRMNWRRHRGP